MEGRLASAAKAAWAAIPTQYNISQAAVRKWLFLPHEQKS
jgi:hypothetical protein